MLNIAVCDDEEYYLAHMKKCIEEILKTGYPQIKYSCETYRTGTGLLNECDNTDIVFLDIALKDENGFDTARELIGKNKNIEIIFVTSHENLVFESFEFRPLGFIRKEFFDSEIIMIMNRIISMMQRSSMLIVAGEGREKYTILADNIKYVDSQGHYVVIYMKEQSVKVRDSITRFECLLSRDGFVRVNRGCIVNMAYVTSLSKGELTLSGTDGKVIKISRSNLKDCEEIYRSLIGKRKA